MLAVEWEARDGADEEQTAPVLGPGLVTAVGTNLTPALAKERLLSGEIYIYIILQAAGSSMGRFILLHGLPKLL